MWFGTQPKRLRPGGLLPRAAGEIAFPPSRARLDPHEGGGPGFEELGFHGRDPRGQILTLDLPSSAGGGCVSSPTGQARRPVRRLAWTRVAVGMIWRMTWAVLTFAARNECASGRARIIGPASSSGHVDDTMGFPPTTADISQKDVSAGSAPGEQRVCTNGGTERLAPSVCACWLILCATCPACRNGRFRFPGRQRLQVGPAALDVSSRGTRYLGTYPGPGRRWAVSIARPFLRFTEAVDRATDHHDTNSFRSTTSESSVRIGIATNAFVPLTNTATGPTKSTMGR